MGFPPVWIWCASVCRAAAGGERIASRRMTARWPAFYGGWHADAARAYPWQARVNRETGPGLARPECRMPSTRLLLPLIALCALLTILAQSGAGVPAGWAFARKPLTTLLVIAWAWPRGRSTPGLRRWVLAGLAFSLAGDVALLRPQQGFIFGLLAFP